MNLKDAAKELGSRYIVEGSVRKGGQRVRITAQLIDAEKIDFLSENNSGMGTEMKVLTKIGPIKLYDYMTVTNWVVEKSIAVDHIGIVTGKGEFKLEEIDENNTKFNWEETLKFPIYLGGVIGEFFGAPILKLIWRKNLKNLKELF